MIIIKEEKGYTIIEILVSLVLISILLLFTSNVFSLITSKALTDSKIEAIEAAKQVMNTTILLKEFENRSIESHKRFIINREIRNLAKTMVIKISIIDKKSTRTIYELQSIQPVEE
jgi:prepilin-type N-terminal cleavage/methylation domain-containing protein